MLAAVPAIRLIAAGASVVFTVPIVIVRGFFGEAFRGIEGRGVERSDVFVADVKAGRELTVAGNAVVDRISKRGTWGERVSWLVLMLPLLILYWWL